MSAIPDYRESTYVAATLRQVDSEPCQCGQPKRSPIHTRTARQCRDLTGHCTYPAAHHLFVPAAWLPVEECE